MTHAQIFFHGNQRISLAELENGAIVWKFGCGACPGDDISCLQEKRSEVMAEEKKTAPEAEEEFITEERLKKAEAFIEEEEGPSRRLTGKMGVFITVVAVIMSLLHLYAAAGIIMTQILRGIHVMFVLFLVFLVFPSLNGSGTESSGMTTSWPPWGSPSSSTSFWTLKSLSTGRSPLPPGTWCSAPS